MVKVILISLVTLGSLVAHADIKYLSVEPVAEGKLSFRDTWDRTKQFCYQQSTDANPQKICLPITQMSEIQLKNNGKWNTDQQTQLFINKFGEDLQKAADNYDRIFVRYLALNANQDYVVHIFFVNKGDSDRLSQTIFEFGTIQSSGSAVTATATGMSFSSGLEYVGAALGAAVALPLKEKNDVKAINAFIVSVYGPLLKIGESVVSTYLTLSSDGHERSERKLP